MGSGGSETVASGGTTFTSGSPLDLANTTFSGNAFAQVDSNDLLTVTDGGNTGYTQQLAGIYATGTGGGIGKAEGFG